MAETDEEQIEAIKIWWAENGKSLLLTLVLAIGAVFGYRAWENQALEDAETASSLYESMTVPMVGEQIIDLSAEIIESTRSVGNQLKIDHSETTYAFLGALYMAKISVEMNDLESAETELQWMLDNDVEDTLKPIVLIRLAYVIAAQGKLEEALSLVSEDQIERNVKAHSSSWYELQGDLYYQLGEMEKARKAYQRAIDSVSEERLDRTLLAKLEDITYVSAE